MGGGRQEGGDRPHLHLQLKIIISYYYWEEDLGEGGGGQVETWEEGDKKDETDHISISCLRLLLLLEGGLGRGESSQGECYHHQVPVATGWLQAVIVPAPLFFII
jgi:hypothetical protein